MDLQTGSPTRDLDVNAARWWRPIGESGDVRCELCPRACVIKPERRGYCFVRQNLHGRLVSTTYGQSTGFCVDPIEKKPLYHFHPGTAVLSFGTPGCNMGCKYCQNWTTVRSRQVEAASARALPDAIAATCMELRVPTVAYTYNEPTIWAEYAIDTARACREAGIRNVAVTNGYIAPAARNDFYEWIDAANVDLKGFTEEFYHHYTGTRLAPVKETLVYLVRETPVWVEITNLLIPGANDSTEEIARMCDWIVDALGPDVPLHFSAFHPDFEMLDRPPTPHETLIAAHETAQAAGINYVYVGNLPDTDRQSTCCPICGELLIRRSGYQLPVYRLDQDHCRYCGATVAGRFDEKPGTWGSRRQPVRIRPLPITVSPDSICPDTTPAKAPGAAASPTRSAAPEEISRVAQKPIDVQNGPAALAVDSLALSPLQEAAVFQAAGRRVLAATCRRNVDASDSSLAGAAAIPLIGAFVSLKRNGHLRSCCGTLAPDIPLSTAIEQAALRAATDDPRFPPISVSELPHLDMEVWLLFNMTPVVARGEARRTAIEIGRHGLQITSGQRRGLLLPGVAVDHRMDAKTFLEAVCRKAGLPLDAWRSDDVELQTFEGRVLRGPFASVRELASQGLCLGGPRGPSASELHQLARFCLQNFIAVVQGATPSYYLPGGYDANVAGLLLRWRFPGTEETIDSTKIGSRDDLPLQATLFELVKAAVAGAASRLISPAVAMQAEVDLAVLTDCALQGTAREPMLDGFDPQVRSLMLSRDTRWALIHDPTRTAEELLGAVRQRAALSEQEDASLVSFVTATTENRPMLVGNTPLDRKGPSVRQPAVAGQFYPSSVQELNRMLDEMIPEDREPEPVAGVMVPHAGWVYSGKLAAQTFSRALIPETVIIFAPRHRPTGPPWSVAPYDAWQVPGRQIASDPDLARRMADSIDGLELDASAHAAEHAIEVQLPIIHQMARDARVVGVTLGRAKLDDIERFAAQLADLLASMPRWPLLVVSSDMNHFADFETTKRLDRMALDAIDSLDPGRLYHTIVDHEISMCGMTPCVLVMETLRRLGKLHQVEHVGYATSAETSGDGSRVVGYAGLLFR